MLHPANQVRFVNQEIGYGVFATEPIPKGTVVAAEDPFSIQITPDKFASLNVKFREIVRFYGYVNIEGNGVVDWDNSKYMNHSCNYNVLSTAYKVCIAIRDIAVGEEITLDYALLEAYFKPKDRTRQVCNCNSQNCRKDIFYVKYENHYKIWFSLTNEAFNCALAVKQPLFDFLDFESRENLIKALKNNPDYSQFRLALIEQRQANFYNKWEKYLEM